MAQLESVCYEYIVICPIGKVLEKTNRAAILSMLAAGILENRTAKRQTEFVNMIDEVIRMHLRWFRTLKRDTRTREGVLKKLGPHQAQKARRLVLSLGRVWSMRGSLFSACV